MIKLEARGPPSARVPGPAVLCKRLPSSARSGRRWSFKKHLLPYFFALYSAARLPVGSLLDEQLSAGPRETGSRAGSGAGAGMAPGADRLRP